ncbi:MULTISPECIES: MarR family winged helix-turn-helix transcriptional regulator [unclassified Pseudofrankia]|uniref:MarR family winged helix-turn-helix transcriptional regulator n=1 Tax=unclassified Pseudofrankia TaxID=2994372 RepID=UPI0009F6EADB|nr:MULTISPECIES: MarR family transcriptional regulator [unclassified Pseudofrankia]MDT3445391.1 MarR family transcriptional regulator [Pseudofrankia sp. BMG5.37]
MGSNGESSSGPDLGLRLSSAHQVWQARTAAALAAAGHGDLRLADLQLLRLIKEGVASVGELAMLFSVTKQAVSRTVDTLTAAGYLNRSTDSADRRRTLLALTQRAENAIAHVLRSRAADLDRLRASLGPDGVTALCDGLAAVAALEPEQEIVIALAHRLRATDDLS